MNVRYYLSKNNSNLVLFFFLKNAHAKKITQNNKIN